MAWLYLPGVEDSNSDSPLRSENITEQSPTLKGNVRPLRSWLRTWDAGGWIKLLSGMTLQPSQAMSLAHSWIRSTLSQQDSLASRGVMLEPEEEPRTNAGSGTISGDWLLRYDPDTSFWRTRQVSLFTAELEPFSATFPRSGSMRNGQVFERAMSVRPIAGRGSSFWPTAVADEVKSGTRNHQGRSLNKEVHTWATPTASDDEHKVTVNSLQPGLVGEVDRFSGRPVQEALKIGGKLSKSDQTSLPRLNPKFVEWLMGWPEGWLELTDYVSSGTE
jgi:hypothetical protein